MFGPHYFGPHYFGARYFATASGDPPSSGEPGTMFGSRYFGPSYFGPRYFGATGQEPQPPDLPVDLLAAITSRIKTSDIAGLFTGGITSVKASDRAVMPYVVVKQRSSSTELRTSDEVVSLVTIETRTYAADTDTAGDIGDQLRPVLVDTVNTFTGAAVSPLIPEGDPRIGEEKGRGRDNAEVRYLEQVYQCRVIRPKR